MAPSERRFERWSNVVMFAVPAVVAIAVAAVTAESSRDFQSTNRDVGVAEPVPVPPRCLEIDRAIVAQLTALLERNGPADAPILERAVYTLNLARRHCLYGWNNRSAEDYEWLRRWLSEQG